MTSTISCVIPTHNRADYLREALASVGRQTLLPAEVIVVSDTPDAAAEQAVAAFGEASGIPMAFQTYSGAGGASESRNRGAASATGDLLAFLDDDDTWAPGFLAASEAALAGSAATVAVSWISMFKGEQSKLGPAIAPGLTARDVVAVNAGTTGSNMVVERSAFEHSGGFDPELRMKNDTDFFYRFLKAGNTYAVVGERLVNQRKHESGQLTGHSKARADNTVRYLEKHRADLSFADRRKLAFVIHRIRRHSSPKPTQRLYHLAMTAANYSVRQYRIDRANKNDKNFFLIPANESAQ
ncbi:hypothetical protein B7R21_03675 [Subtercola boreus]|uniref:Glycosyltransferase 2-like domain-containing protein n=1 Tax=Subtercola boreus TaxID=120213 RepID=A0A3E0VYL2_9MICO|nr:glycosyltransferase family A protein [Subtercola boreus]RFA15142.1 hypothetical protein B7R21_03675 [Subtercola boreus]